MNALETLNQSVFLALNAQPGAAEGLLLLARFCATGIVFMMPASRSACGSSVAVRGIARRCL